jgi:hypothetical protein
MEEAGRSIYQSASRHLLKESLRGAKQVFRHLLGVQAGSFNQVSDKIIANS